MAQVILFLVVIGVTIYAAIDCFGSEDAEIKGLPKPLWLLVILCLPLLGGGLWILFGSQGAPGTRTYRRPRAVAPDDDPDFLRTLQAPRRRPDTRPEGDDDPPTPS